MQNATLILRANRNTGDPLPSVFTNLDNMGAKLRRGQVSLIAAAPGVGKSAISTHWAVKSGVPTLYFSPDSDSSVILPRVVASEVNQPIDDVEQGLNANDAELMEILDGATDHIWFDFRTSPGARDLNDEIDCYAYVIGEYPQLIVYDCLKDTHGDGTDRERYNDLISFLNDVARSTDSHVQILHHVTGQYESGDIPVPLSGIMEKVSKTPRLVLTVYRKSPGILGICIVKNNKGPSDGSAGLQVDIGWMPERAWFSE